MSDSFDLEKASGAKVQRQSVPETEVALSDSDTDHSQAPERDSGWADQQPNTVPQNRLFITFLVIALVQFTSYLGQSTISTAVPALSAELQLGTNVPWVASSFPIASTCTQLINGRLSDIFGRKNLILVSLVLLGIGNLCGGFAQNGAMLFAFRALSGLGGGVINVVLMIIASEITTLDQCSKYNGLIGAAVILSNGIGPLVGGALTSRVGWRWALWYDVPWIALMFVLAAWVLPKSKITGRIIPKLKLVDWYGVIVAVPAVLFLLIPLSQGGAAIPWDSPLVIAMLPIGAVLVLVFLLIEWKVARLPVLPLHLFNVDISANILLTQSTLIGFVFWGNLYYIPLYLQNVLGYSPIVSGALVIPMVATQGVGSIAAGYLISKLGRYNPVLITSQVIWLVGACLQLLYNRQTKMWEIIVFGLLQGVGIGGAFQPSLVALLAHSWKKDLAVMNSLRSFVRAIGSSIGLIVSGAILNNEVRSALDGILPDATIARLTESTSRLSSVQLSPAEHEMVLNAYMKGIHAVFITYAVLMGVCFLLALLVKDDGLAERDAPSRLQQQEAERTIVDEDGSEHGRRDSDPKAEQGKVES